MIELDEVTCDLGGRRVLQDVDVVLAERRVGVIGANGSGKSTLARLLNGLVLPTKGRVRVDGLDTDKDVRAVRRRVGFVFQDPDAQIVYPTVAEDVAFGLRNRGLGKPAIDERVEAVLRQYGLWELRDQPAHLLSGGEKQLLALAAVLVTEPAYLVLDEPTTLLDLGNSRRIAGVLDSLPQPVVAVSHDLALLEDFDRVVVLDRGRVVADGPARDSIAAYRAMVT